QAEVGIRSRNVTGVQTCALPIFGLTRFRGVACALLGVGLIIGGLIGGVRGLVVRGLRRRVLGRVLGLASVVGRLGRLLTVRGSLDLAEDPLVEDIVVGVVGGSAVVVDLHRGDLALLP